MQWRHRHSTPSGYPFPGRGGACSGVSSLSQRESTARSGSLQDLASLATRARHSLSQLQYPPRKATLGLLFVVFLLA